MNDNDENKEELNSTNDYDNAEDDIIHEDNNDNNIHLSDSKSKSEEKELNINAKEKTDETGSKKNENYEYKSYDISSSNEPKARNYYDTSSQYKDDTINKSKKTDYPKIILFGVLFAIIFGAVAGIIFSTLSTSKGYVATEEIEIEDNIDEIEGKETEDSVQIESTEKISGTSVYDFSEVVENCISSIVSITNVSTSEFQTMFGTYQQESISSGSGIIIGQNDTELLIVTNNHVISGADEISVYFNSDNEENEYDEDYVVSAKVKGTAEEKDIAIIAVQLDDLSDDVKENIKIATIGDSSSLKVGEAVIAIGNAYGYGISVTSGIVSALDREATVEYDNITVTNKFIQTDAAINPGNSGGALLNSKGELIGINSVKIVSDDVEGMGYAIPISDVMDTINELMNRETRDALSEDEQGYLGVADCIDVTSDVSESYNMPMGIYVRTVIDGMAADNAGLKSGDIITKIDGISVTNYEQLKEQMTYYASGETITITVERINNSDYEEITLDITLSSIDEMNEYVSSRQTQNYKK